MAKGGLNVKVARLREERLAASADGKAVPDSFQGVSKAKIARVLRGIALAGNNDLVDGVFALLDDETPSWFSNAPTGATFADGASTAHLASHVGVLQRGEFKLDREGRDYWIKPLRDLGGIEAILLNDGAFIPGHVVAKSPNSAYRLSEGLKAVLKAPDGEWQGLLTAWADADAVRARRAFQAEAAEASRLLVDTGHSGLIQASIHQYAERFLPGYQVVYVDDGDGDRITDKDRAALAAAGLTLELGDAMPDVLLWCRQTDKLWVIEAVTSDGEVDLHKVAALQRMAKRCDKAGVDFTTTYLTWKDAAARQGKHGNIAVGTYIWIQADPAKHFKVESFA